MKRLLPWTFTALALLTVGAAADLSVKDGDGVTRIIKNFVCETTKLCNATVLIKSDGTEVGISSAPLRVDPTGTTTQPVSGTVAATLGNINLSGSALPISAGTPIPTSPTPYPQGAVPYTATATGSTGATTATLAGAASVTTYICGFSIRANATAAATGNATVTGVITATMNFTQWTAPNASGIGVTEMIFSPCIPASGTNQSVAVVSAAPGTGGAVSVTAWGYKL